MIELRPAFILDWQTEMPDDMYKELRQYYVDYENRGNHTIFSIYDPDELNNLPLTRQHLIDEHSVDIFEHEVFIEFWW